MSSSYVRDQISGFLASEASSELAVDLTSQYGEIKEFLEDFDVPSDSPWLGVQYVGGDEVPVGLAANNQTGLYRETGAIILHVIDVARLGVGARLLTRGEALRNLFRGRRIGDIIIESVTPMNFDDGATLQFAGGFVAGTFHMAYIRDINLGT